MDTLEHDPRTKLQIKNALYDFLYNPVQRQFKSRLDTLIVRNAIIGGYSHKHFIYKGIVYNSDTTPPPVRKNRLHASLCPQMDEYLEELHELNTQELPYVLGFLNQVLNASLSLQDYKRVLPESVHYPINRLMSTCPCKTANLSDSKVASLMSKNEEIIHMMKRRLTMNLLL